ncbi:hypothetical protein HOY80DRAFT_1087678 [Tuber brumale]|nr:hypothetical protein HOY80DRAFT_1087678 [Tuber brumale]
MGKFGEGDLPGHSTGCNYMVNNEVRVMQPMGEIENLGRKNAVFFCSHGAQSVGNIPVGVGKWNDDLTSISDTKVYGPKDTGASNTHHRPKVRIGPLISSSGQECCLRRGTHEYSLAFAFGNPCRIAPEGIEYTRTSEHFVSRNSIGSSTVRDLYIYQSCHNKQSKQFTTVQRTNAEKNTDNSGRKLKWGISYSKITVREAEKRLGLRLNLRGIPVKRMLDGKHVLLGPDTILKLKRKIYQDLVNCMRAGGYPTEAKADFMEGDINAIVGFTIYPIVAQFTCETERKLELSREKEITSIDSSTSGVQECIVMDYISCYQRKCVLVVEVKNALLGEAIKQCFLCLKDMWDFNGGGTVYGFITAGDCWRMISFDGTFMLSDKMESMFDSMVENEEKWMAEYSILVECFNVALSNGGKDLVEVV